MSDGPISLAEHRRARNGAGRAVESTAPVSALRLEAVLDAPAPAGTKGLPLDVANLKVRDIGAAGWNLLADDVSLPAAVILDTVLRNNIEAMATFARSHGAQLAPHGKTTMAPQLFARQIEAGAWGLSAATPAHLAVYLDVGVKRIIYANQAVDASALDLIVDRLASDPGLELICLVDSRAAMAALVEAARRRRSKRRIDILIELGMPGGRTGLRTVGEAVALAARIASEAPELRVRGVEAFEGVVAFDADGAERVDALIDRLVAAAVAITPLVHDGVPLLSVGGSAFFPRIVERLEGHWQPFNLILRSGCYLVHDHGLYEAGRLSPHCRGGMPMTPALAPALEVWGHIQSRPEPGLAYATVGKRDISHDAGLPIPIKWAPRGGRDVFDLAPGDIETISINDQHTYLRVQRDDPIAVGDRIAFGCSHPCTTFDKWKILHLVDESYDILEGIATRF